MQKHPSVDCDIVANSDSKELLDILCNNGKRKVYAIERTADLSGDRVSKIDVIRDCLTRMEKITHKNYAVVVDLDITSPLRTVQDIENLIDKQQTTGCDVAFSVVESRRNPYFNMVKKTEHGYAKVIQSDFVARQQAPEIFDMNASMYAYRPDFLRIGKGIFDGYCEAIQMYDTGILDLDRGDDFVLMEVVAGYLFKANNGLGEIFDNITITKC